MVLFNSKASLEKFSELQNTWGREALFPMFRAYCSHNQSSTKPSTIPKTLDISVSLTHWELLKQFLNLN